MADVWYTDEDIITGLTFNIGTASRVCVTDADGVLTTSSATDTEGSYLSGVTSAIQTQTDAKLNLASPVMTTPTITNLVMNNANAQTTGTGFSTIATISLSDVSTYIHDIYVIGRKSDGTQRGATGLKAGYYRNGGGATEIDGGIGYGTIWNQYSDTSWAVQIITSSNDILVQAHGNSMSAETVNWDVFYYYIKNST